jgi:hypothetical protein
VSDSGGDAVWEREILHASADQTRARHEHPQHVEVTAIGHDPAGGILAQPPPCRIERGGVVAAKQDH